MSDTCPTCGADLYLTGVSGKFWVASCGVHEWRLDDEGGLKPVRVGLYLMVLAGLFVLAGLLEVV